MSKSEDISEEMSKAEQILKPYAPVIFDKNFDHIDKTDAIIKAMQAHTNQTLDELKEKVLGRVSDTSDGRYSSNITDAKVHELQNVITLIEEVQDDRDS